MVRCIVGWLVAIVAALITMPAADAIAIESVRPPPVTHTYDSPPAPTADAYTHYDRGPPSVRVDVHRHGAGGPGSRGTLASADGAATTYTYDSSGQLVSVAHSVALEALKPRTTTGGDGLVLSGAVSSFPVGLVAAKTESGLIRLTTEESWANTGTLGRHFRDHGADFAAQSADDYARRASEFFQRGGAQQLPTKIASDGTIRMFDPATNTFGSFAPNGMTKTFFKPTSATYWDRQPGTLQ